MTIQAEKVEIGLEEITFLGHRVKNNVISPIGENIKKILELEIPTTQKQVKSLLGLVNYYRKFIRNLAEIVNPLNNLLRKGQPQKVTCDSECREAIEKIKKIFSTDLILRLPDKEKVFYVSTDASGSAIGGCLMQQYECLHPIAYVSRKLSEAERRYSVVEREALAIVWVVTKLESYLLGKEFCLLTDHKPLQFMQQKSMKNGRICRWFLILQNFKFEIKAISGSINIVADMLSRVTLS